MHVPSVGGKILSLKKLDQKGFEIRIVGGHIHIMKANEVYAEALLGGDLYEVNMKVIPAEESIMAAVKRDATTADLPTWHRRLGHLGDTALRKLITSGTVKGMEVTDTCLNGICEDCVVTKMDEKPFENQTERDSQTFGTLHANIIGPMSPKAHWTHAKFSLIMHDDCSGFGFVFNLAHKDEMAKVIINLEKSIENKFQKRVHTLKTNNRGEFINQELKSHCHSRGISLMTSVPYSLELNGQAERQNRMHVEGARTMLRDSDLGKDLWGEALSTHVYICNRCPSSILPGNIMPYEKVFAQTPCINHLCIFGSKCFFKVPDETQSKLDDEAKECRLIGYEGDSIYVVVDADKKRLCLHNVIFIEGTATHSDSTRSMPMEFQNQEVETSEDNNIDTHPTSDHEASKC